MQIVGHITYEFLLFLYGYDTFIHYISRAILLRISLLKFHINDQQILAYLLSVVKYFSRIISFEV